MGLERSQKEKNKFNYSVSKRLFKRYIYLKFIAVKQSPHPQFNTTKFQHNIQNHQNMYC